MTYDVASVKPTHHLILTDANGIQLGLVAVDGNGKEDANSIKRDPVELSALKTTSGNQSFSDQRPPYATLAQEDWSGGRGARKYEDDVTRFASSYRCETGRIGKIMLSGREKYGTGARSALTYLPGSMRLIPLTGSQERLAIRILADGSWTVDKIFLWVSCFGASTNNLTVRLCADYAGGTKPGVVLQTKVVAPTSLYTFMLSELFPFDITNQAIVSGTYYWIEVYPTASTTTDYWKVGVNEAAGTTKQSADDGVNWSACTSNLYYRLADNTAQLGGEFFTYKRGLYFVTRPTDGSASKVWKNTLSFVAASNAGNMNKVIFNGAPAWTVNEHAGKVALIIEGPGSDEMQPWRVVVSNDADDCVVDSNWLIEHTTATVCVLLGGDSDWTDITDVTKITKTVTDVVVNSENYVFLAQGEDGNIQQFKEEISGGVWTRTWGSQVTKAVFLEMFNDAGTMKVVRTNASGATAGQVSQSAVPAWGAALSWGTGKDVGDKYERITGLCRYVNASEVEIVAVQKESGPYQWDGADVTMMSPEAMKAIIAETTGRVSAWSDVYMYVSVRNTVWRFYAPTFDDIGWMLDEGLPTNLQGVCSAIIPYPGRTVFGIDAGTTGYSTLMENNSGASFHEKYRAPYGERIFAATIQVIPGTANLDRMWIRQGAGFVWLPYPSNDFDPSRDPNFLYTHEGAVEMASMYAGLYDAWKYWKTLKLQLENLVADTAWVEADYALDDGDWQTLPDAFEDMPLSEQEFGTVDGDGRRFGASSKKFNLRLRLLSRDVTKSPLVTALIINAVTVVEPKFFYSLVAMTDIHDLNGNPDPPLSAGQKTALVALGVEDDVADFGDTLTPAQKLKLLDAWSGTAKSLWLECVNPAYDGKPVFLLPLPGGPYTSLQQAGEYKYSMVVRMQEA